MEESWRLPLLNSWGYLATWGYLDSILISSGFCNFIQFLGFILIEGSLTLSVMFRVMGRNFNLWQVYISLPHHEVKKDSLLSTFRIITRTMTVFINY